MRIKLSAFVRSDICSLTIYQQEKAQKIVSSTIFDENETTERKSLMRIDIEGRILSDYGSSSI